MMNGRSTLLVANTGPIAAPAIHRLPPPTVGVVRAPWQPTPFEPTPVAAVLSQAPEMAPVPPAQQIKRLVMSADVSNQQLASRINDLIDQQRSLAHHFTTRMEPLQKTFNQLKKTFQHETIRQEQDRAQFEEQQTRRQSAGIWREILMAAVIAAVTATGTLVAQRAFLPKPGPAPGGQPMFR